MASGLAFIMVYFMRGTLRFQYKTVALLYGIYLILWQSFEWTPGIPVIVFVLLYTYSMILPAVIFKREIVLAYNIQFMVLMLNNLLPNIFIALFGVIYAIVTGNHDFWVNSDNFSTGMRLLFLLILVLNLIFSFLICSKIVPELKKMKSWQKYLLFVIGTVFNYIVSTCKIIFATDYQASPGGWILIAETVEILVGIIVILFFFTKILKKKRKVSIEMKKRLAEENEKYQKNFELQQTLRELNHDLRNYIMAGDRQLAENIKEYAEKVLRETGEDKDD